MYQLVIDDNRCVACGNCEAILPGVLGAFVAGRLLISPTNMHDHHVEVQRAISSCHLEALTLTEVPCGGFVPAGGDHLFGDHPLPNDVLCIPKEVE